MQVIRNAKNGELIVFFNGAENSVRLEPKDLRKLILWYTIYKLIVVVSLSLSILCMAMVNSDRRAIFFLLIPLTALVWSGWKFFTLFTPYQKKAEVVAPEWRPVLTSLFPVWLYFVVLLVAAFSGASFTITVLALILTWIVDELLVKNANRR